jgi:hypothetical protein
MADVEAIRDLAASGEPHGAMGTGVLVPEVCEAVTSSGVNEPLPDPAAVRIDY